MTANEKNLKLKYRGAQWRLRHYAGIPFVHMSGRDDPIQYETALDDCHILADAIEAAGGDRPIVVDIKKEFMIRASAIRYETLNYSNKP